MSSKKELTKAEERVRIARDVIAQLKAKKYVAVVGTYAAIWNDEKYEEKFEGLVNPQEAVRAAQRCDVCARGALVLATIDRYDRLELMSLADIEDQAEDGADGGAYINRYFSPSQLIQMEDVYEGNPWHGSDWHLMDDLVNKWWDMYPEAMDRMEAIMRNVIRNDGTFKAKDVSQKPRVPFSRRVAGLEE